MNNHCALRRCSLFILSLFIASCTPSTRPSLKIGLVAPFAGRYREVGEEVIYAIRLAVREANAAGGIGGYTVELMALDDGGDPARAAEQAHKLATDPQVVGVIGHWLDSTTLAAAPVYADFGIPFLATTTFPDLNPAAFRLWLTDSAYLAAAPDTSHCPLPCDSLEDLSWLQSTIPLRFAPGTIVSNHAKRSKISGPPLWGLSQFPRLLGDEADDINIIAPAPLPADSSDPDFADRYRSISPGVAPHFLAVLAYDAAKILFSAIEQNIKIDGLPTRSGVAAALAQTDYNGLSGHFSFNSDRDWAEGKGWVYQWQDGILK